MHNRCMYNDTLVIRYASCGSHPDRPVIQIRRQVSVRYRSHPSSILVTAFSDFRNEHSRLKTNVQGRLGSIKCLPPTTGSAGSMRPVVGV